MNADERWDEPTVYLNSALTYLDFVNTLLKAVQFADSTSYTKEILTPQQLTQITDVYKQIKLISQTIDDIKTELEMPRDEDTFSVESEQFRKRWMARRIKLSKSIKARNLTMTNKYDKSKVHNDLTEASNHTFAALSLVMNDMAFGLDQLSEQEIFSIMNAQISLNKAMKDIREILSNPNNQEDKTNA